MKRTAGEARTMVAMGMDEPTAHPLPPGAAARELAEERRRRRPAIRVHASLTAALGATGTVLVLAALVFAPGWPVYLAIVAGVVTGIAAAMWARR